MHMRTYLRIAACGSLMLFSQALYALGLGNAEVHSYLNEPLNTRIRLINATPEELNTITASLASAADMEQLGLSRSVSVPLHFRINADPDDAYVEVTSRLPVNDPVVQMVVQLHWSGGRMLREYNLFIDPPTLAARPPAPGVSSRQPAVSQAPREDYPDPANLDVVETVKTPSQERVQAPEAAAPEPTHPAPTAGTPSSPSATQQAAPASAPDTTAQTTLERTAPEAGQAAVDQAAAESAEPPMEAAAREQEAIESPASDEYGPVQRGETLWSIAADYTRGTGYSINQAMLAIQRLNPDAFGGSNINSLHRGAILRMPADAEVARLTPRQAMLEAMRQEQAYQAMRAGRPYDDSPPQIADVALQSAVVEPVVTTDLPASEPAQEARLVLVPPSDGEPSAGGSGAAEDQPTGAMSSAELEEVLARTEEELANAQQENAYLSERIRELEERLAATDSDGLVADEGMAALESGLREDRLNRVDEVEADPAERSWLEGMTAWLVPLLVIIIGLGVWLLRRMTAQTGGSADRVSEGPSEAEPQTIGGVRTEVEGIPETLEDDEPDDPVTDNVVALGEKSGDSTRKAKPADDTEVVELDTSDPETQLDLARAYISMGDPEAARAMLESVLEHGNEAQAAEARGMMKEL